LNFSRGLLIFNLFILPSLVPFVCAATCASAIGASGVADVAQTESVAAGA